MGWFNDLLYGKEVKNAEEVLQEVLDSEKQQEVLL